MKKYLLGFYAMVVAIIIVFPDLLFAQGCPPGTKKIGEDRTETPTAIIIRPVCQKFTEVLGDVARRKSIEVRAGRMTDCEAMAQIFEEIGRDVDWDFNQVVDLMGAVVAGGVRYRDATLVAAAPGTVQFGERGFRPAYIDKLPGNQVRHFVAYFVLGAKLSGGLLAAVVAELRDAGEPGDHELGLLGANLGSQMRNSPQLIRGLGGSIRTTICR